jgi:Predicted Zn-dependent protease (DUF2268)
MRATTLFFAIAGCLAAQNTDPMKARLVTSDIPRFWAVFDNASLHDAADLFQRDYFDPGSEGLKTFVKVRIGNARNLAAVAAARPRYFSAIRENTLALDRNPDVKSAIQASFRKLKEIYPDAVFPDVYFLIGALNSGGTTDGGKGLLIGLEMNARDDRTPVDELTKWERSSVGQIANVPHIVAHEVIHVEQKQANPSRESDGRKPTLLEQALDEGGADFLGEMISGGVINRTQRAFGNEHERELWDEFRTAMNGTDARKWLYEGDRAKGRPADMGYYMGYRICEAFYRKAADKSEALRRILALNDPEGLLRDSGYAEQVASANGK